MNKEKMQNNQLGEQELENIAGGRTSVTFDYSDPKGRKISSVELDENSCRFLKKRGYDVKAGVNKLSYGWAGSESEDRMKEGLRLLISNGYIVQNAKDFYSDKSLSYEDI